MEFQDSYLEAEVREGFYIPSLMKRAWAAQMEVLEIITNICKKYHIQYFAEWGTLLGAVRHQGRIPWDDDIDIGMFREEYERFCEVVDQELPAECWFLDHQRVKGYENRVGRVINSRVHVVEGENLEKYHGFPYVAGIDIFCLDEVPLSEGEVTNIYYWEAFSDYRLKKEWFREIIMLPYENIEMPVPIDYEKILEKKYGANWHEPVMAGGGHDYPTYSKQQKFLEEENAAQLFAYRYSKDEVEEVENSRLERESLEDRVKACLLLLHEAHEEIRSCMDKKEIQIALQILEECQSVAIQLGTMIEQELGEGNMVVCVLEQYCEVVFQSYQQMLDENTGNRMANQLKQFSEFESKIAELASTQLKKKKHIVIVPYKGSMWKTMNRVWEKATEMEEAEVFVVPAPYYYKDAYGQAKRDEMQYETEAYPGNVSLVSYEEYDFERHHPDAIVIQCPYDEYDYGMTIHPFFYAKNLKKYTDCLVYVPGHEMNEIGPKDERAKITLKSYCNMPGVIHADQVILQSEQMKQVYAELLTEFAGEDTKEIWESKIRSEFEMGD